MLSFMRENEQSNHSSAQPSSRQTTQQKNTEEYLTVATRKKQLQKSTLLLVSLFCIGLLCLLFMIKRSTPQTAAAQALNSEDAQIETVITRLIGAKTEMFSRMDEIVNKFYEFSDVPQLSTENLAKNPFKTERFLGDLKIVSPLEESDYSTDAKMTAKHQPDMQLLSIMQSKQGNCCMIDDKILYDGDSIRGFKVTQIGNNFVKLKSENSEIILKLLQ